MLYQSWPWYVSGPLIALVMAILVLMGKRFGMSSNLETFCSIGGAGRFVDYFKIDLKSKRWSLLVVLGRCNWRIFGSTFLLCEPRC